MSRPSSLPLSRFLSANLLACIKGVAPLALAVFLHLMEYCRLVELARIEVPDQKSTP